MAAGETPHGDSVGSAELAVTGINRGILSAQTRMGDDWLLPLEHKTHRLITKHTIEINN